MTRYAFFYVMKNDPEQIRPIVPLHIEYWKSLALPDYQGGPFADRSGGLITFSAASSDEAMKLISSDPFVSADVLAERSLEPWLVD